MTTRSAFQNPVTFGLIYVLYKYVSMLLNIAHVLYKYVSMLLNIVKFIGRSCSTADFKVTN